MKLALVSVLLFVDSASSGEADPRGRFCAHNHDGTVEIPDTASSDAAECGFSRQARLKT